jgi:hypothetical protein
MFWRKRPRVGPLIGLAAMLAGLAACTRLPQPMNLEQGGIEVDSQTLRRMPGSIPLAWGNLVSVTLDPINRNDFRLWFQDDAGEIRVLGIKSRTHELWTAALVIHRD